MNCLADAALKKVVSCSVNPRLGRELRLNGEYAQTPKRKKVLVIGGGFAGMTAAATAAERGHSVTLVEMSGQLGGILKFTNYDELKNDLRLFKDHLIAQVEKTGVKVELNKVLSKRNIAAYGADAIIIAAGSAPKKPPIPGIDLPHVCHVAQLYERKDGPGKKVGIIGGGLAGGEAAVELAGKGCSVTVVEALKGVARDANRLISDALFQTATGLPITFLDETNCLQINPENILLQSAAGGTSLSIEADTVLYAVGMEARSELYQELFDFADTVVPVGDCVRPRRIAEAIFEGYFAAMNL
jgi:NADPH-dependent 2,4-dienoyl-CoA reductase/sulfur reductase-like enzyme